MLAATVSELPPEPWGGSTVLCELEAPTDSLEGSSGGGGADGVGALGSGTVPPESSGSSSERDVSIAMWARRLDGSDAESMRDLQQNRVA